MLRAAAVDEAARGFLAAALAKVHHQATAAGDGCGKPGPEQAEPAIVGQAGAEITGRAPASARRFRRDSGIFGALLILFRHRWLRLA